MLEQPSQPSLPAPFARLSLIVSFVLLGLTLSFILDLPSQEFDFTFLGSDASINVSGVWILGLLLAILTAAGVDSIARTHPRVHLVDHRYLFILWITPALGVITAAIILAGTSDRIYGLVGVVFAGAYLVAVILGEYFTIDLSDARYSYARLGVNLAVYLLALTLFATIYGWKIRSLFSSTLVGLASGFLSLELFRGAESELRRTWLYAMVVGLSMGEILWTFNYWNLSALLGGALLLIFFYAFTGMVQQYLWGRLTRLVWFEFLFIIFGAIVLLYLLHPI